MFEALKSLAATTGKPKWKALLAANADLHARSIICDDNFPNPWEHIGPGYCYGPAFGHWDLIHELMDQMDAEPENVRLQLLNNLHYQLDDGFIPGCIYVREGKAVISTVTGHPPVWFFAADRYFRQYGDRELLAVMLEALKKQISWFRNNRHADKEGYFYNDIENNRKFESGVDEGVRFLRIPTYRAACVDATSHMYALCSCAADWSDILGVPGSDFAAERDRLGEFIRTKLYDPETGWFYDEWLRDMPDRFPESFEGAWPMIVGAASHEMAARVRDHLMNPGEFFAAHPFTTVSRTSPRYELRMWRGPAWNSMAYWAVQGLLKYGFASDAKSVCERVLDSAAHIYEQTGKIWEFYHPDGDDPHNVHRKPWAENVPDHPCADYLGHNPRIDMARIWERC